MGLLSYDRKAQTDLIWFSFGPGGFVCATRGGVAMRSWPSLLPTFGLSSFLAQAALRAPHEVAFAMRS